MIDLLKLEEYVDYFEVFKEATRVNSHEVTSVNASLGTIEKWLADNKLEDTSLLSKMDLPKMSEKDGESLQKLLVEFENISEKNRKINDNNFLREQMQSIDFQKYQNDLKVYPELEDVSQKLSSKGAWSGEGATEQKMIDKYEKLLSTSNHICPTQSLIHI